MTPPVLYKYMSSDTAKLVLQSGKLRWSSPTIFNDTAEFDRMPRFEPTLANSFLSYPEIILDIVKSDKDIETLNLGPDATVHVLEVRAFLKANYAEELILNFLPRNRPDADSLLDQRLREFAQKDIKETRVLCLTTKFDNYVMWGTYADSHAGCVLGFKPTTAPLSPLTEAKQVAYSDHAPILGSGMDFLLYGHTPELRKKTVAAIYFTKKGDWKYEQEWRAMTTRREEIGNSSNDFKYYPEELESVTFGSRAIEEAVAEIVMLVKSKFPHVSIYKMISEKGNLLRLPLKDTSTQK